LAYLAPIVRARAQAILLAAALVALLAACGGGDEDSEDSGCAATGEPNAKGQVTLIAAETKDAGDVIADAACQPLYVNDVDNEKKISCTGECARVWIPVTLPGKGSVRAVTPQQVGQVDLVKRPDGQTQVALNDKPLYRFSGDTEPGDTNGEGVSDSYAGVDYEWSVLTLDEAGPQPGSPSSPPRARKPPGN
jgi:predicted lipoprotein with Yx(FWY)xxD motif